MTSLLVVAPSMFLTSVASASCILQPNKSPQLDMWWQGKNSGSPKHSGRVKFEYLGGSSSDDLLFKGRFWSGGSAYNIERATFNGNTFYFKTTTFDRPGRTGRESYLKGSAKCGDLGLLGTFRYVDKDPKATIYVFDFGMTPIPSTPRRP